MKETPFDAEIAELRTKLNEVRLKLADLQEKRCQFLSPFKMGDILTDNKGRRAQVTMLGEYWPDGRLLKKDGTLGKYERTLDDFDGWHKAEEK